MSVVPSAAASSALTVRPAEGCQPVSSTPVERLKAARRVRVAPPADVNFPPAYRRPFAARSARTSAFAPGFQDVALPVETEIAAMFVRDAPPAVVNVPPTYT